MTKRLEVAPAPAPLEEYAQHFDGLFGKSNQREGFRRYVEGLLLLKPSGTSGFRD